MGEAIYILLAQAARSRSNPTSSVSKTRLVCYRMQSLKEKYCVRLDDRQNIESLVCDGEGHGNGVHCIKTSVGLLPCRAVHLHGWRAGRGNRTTSRAGKQLPFCLMIEAAKIG